MADEVRLAIGGREYGGWKTVSIDRDIDAMADAFELTVTDQWPGQWERWEIEAGTSATLTVGGDTLITGYVDRLESKLASNARAISIAGRSRAGDLVDCAAVHKPGSWKGRTIEQIAAELVKPFGLTVTARADTGAALKDFALQPGETVAEALARMIRMRAVLIVSTPAGDIEIVTPESGRRVGAIWQGQDILELSASHDVRDRFSEYLVKGQAKGDDKSSGKTVSAVRASSRDPAVGRYRPLIVVAEEQADIASARKRAAWEATVRAARAQELEVSVVGWRDKAGALWRPIDRVEVIAPAAWISAELMIAGVRLELSDAGRTSTFRLVRPQAYTQLAVPEKAKSSKIDKDEDE